MTGTQILARANYLVDDTIDSAEALSIINEGLQSLSQEAPYVKVESLTITPPDNSVAIPDNVIEILWVKINQVKLEEVEPESEDPTVTGTPSKYAVENGNIVIYPLPEADDDPITLKVSVKSGYTALASLNSTPSDLPAAFHMALAYFLAIHFRFNDEDADWVKLSRSEYYNLVNGLMTYQNTRSGYHKTENTMPYLRRV